VARRLRNIVLSARKVVIVNERGRVVSEVTRTKHIHIRDTTRGAGRHVLARRVGAVRDESMRSRCCERHRTLRGHVDIPGREVLGDAAPDLSDGIGLRGGEGCCVAVQVKRDAAVGCSGAPGAAREGFTVKIEVNSARCTGLAMVDRNAWIGLFCLFV
jgi:hypothetical protein